MNDVFNKDDLSWKTQIIVAWAFYAVRAQNQRFHKA